KALLVSGRSGAATGAEHSVIGRPSILVPSPHSFHNDRKSNAEKLIAAGTAIMSEQKNGCREALADRLADLLIDGPALAGAAEAALRQGAPDAVKRLADLVEALGRGEFVTQNKISSISDQSGSAGPLQFIQEGC